MDRRTFLLTSAAAGAVAWLPAAAGDQRDRIIIDALGAISNSNAWIDSDRAGSLEYVPPSPAELDPRSVADAKRSGVTAINITLAFSPGGADIFEKAIRSIAWWDEHIRLHPDNLIKVYTAEDILEAHRSGRVGIIYGFQNGVMMGEDATRAETFAQLGVRVIQLTYNTSNQIGDGAMSPDNNGLSEFGREVVAQLNAHKVLIDVSHSGEQTCLDAIEMSSSPIALTHSGCRALADLPRNKTDRELRLLAQKGGVIGIYFMPFLSIGVQSMAKDLIAHIEHALNVCGEDHVGIGTDNSLVGIDNMPKYREIIAEQVRMRKEYGIAATGESEDIVPLLPDISGPDQYHRLAEMLADRGHSERVIDKVLGENFLRLMGDVWSGKA